VEVIEIGARQAVSLDALLVLRLALSSIKVMEAA
jgi:hypothetical protein